ncbi:MAG: hypothetical protein QOI17_1328, partial [Gaiellales bacterium]|nr:hypothetical protein [Gaiellales bacterium]
LVVRDVRTDSSTCEPSGDQPSADTTPRTWVA